MVSRYILRTFLVFLLLCSNADAGLSQKEEYVYNEKTGDTVTSFTWSLTRKENAEIRSVSKDERFLNICDPGGETFAWSFEKPSGRIEAHRKNNTIFISGEMNGEKVDKEIIIDELPWFQPLSYSLRHLIAKHDSPVTFWMIRPDTLDAVKLKAKFTQTEKLKMGGKEIVASCVEIRMAGLFSALWKGRYWFRAEDGLFLRYQSRHGPPGTPLTEVSLRM